MEFTDCYVSMLKNEFVILQESKLNKYHKEDFYQQSVFVKKKKIDPGKYLVDFFNDNLKKLLKPAKVARFIDVMDGPFLYISVPTQEDSTYYANVAMTPGIPKIIEAIYAAEVDLDLIEILVDIYSSIRLLDAHHHLGEKPVEDTGVVSGLPLFTSEKAVFQSRMGVLVEEEQEHTNQAIPLEPALISHATSMYELIAMMFFYVYTSTPNNRNRLGFCYDCGKLYQKKNYDAVTCSDPCSKRQYDKKRNKNPYWVPIRNKQQKFSRYKNYGTDKLPHLQAKFDADFEPLEEKYNEWLEQANKERELAEWYVNARKGYEERIEATWAATGIEDAFKTIKQKYKNDIVKVRGVTIP
ncbi:hypothetical protein LJC60_05605 [Ruminococcaceae bacterium OttesenSCG-928-D13]|nr:hypothetical protein [Ruminococcaceae bacterium OttesenSCG-928-D13]